MSMVASSSTSRFHVHRSTIVVALLLLMLGVILMVPGLYIKTDPQSNYSSPGVSVFINQVEHGWPYTYLTRFAHEEILHPSSWPDRPPLPPWLTWSGWTDWRAEESYQFFPLALFLNLILHTTAILGLIFLWERRVRRQKHILQFKISELALLGTIVAVTLGIFVHERKEYRRELAVVRELESYEQQSYPLGVYSGSPPAFWSRLVGSAVLPECFYRPSELVYNPYGLDHPVSILPVIPQVLELKKLDSIFYYLPHEGGRGDYDPAFDCPLDLFVDSSSLRTLNLRTLAGYTINRHDAGKLVKLQQLTRLVVDCGITPGAKEILDKHMPNCDITYQ